MDKPPFDVERKLSEYIFRHLSTLENVLNNFMVESRNRRGGMNKTINQVIGNLNASYAEISNYQSQTLDKPYGVSSNLPIGSLTVLKPGNYTISIAINCTFNADNVSGRTFNVQVFNKTDNTPLVSDLGANFVGITAYGASINLNISTYFSPAMVNKELVLRLGGGHTFANFIVTHCVFSLVSLR